MGSVFKKTAEQEYKDQINYIHTFSALQLAINDPLTQVGRDYYALLMQKTIEKEELEQFQERLAFLTYTEQQRLKVEHSREVEYRAEQDRERLLKSWTQAQLKHLPADRNALPSPVKGLLEKISELLAEIGSKMLVFLSLNHQKTAIEKQWQAIHQAKADQIIAGIKNVPLIGPDGEAIVLTEEKIQALTQTLIPPAPALIPKLNPYLAKRIREEDNEENMGICVNLSKMNGVVGELGFHTLLTNSVEPLYGAALLQAILKHKPIFNERGITFNAVDHVATANLIREGIGIVNHLTQLNKQMDQLERQVKSAVKEVNEQLKDLELKQRDQTSPTPFNIKAGLKR